ncbi:MAG TPA: dipeptidase PepV [Bacillota bacterium]|nr:dipeptidase PepV [Bacillota bacterium]HPV13634.1 dipeptidase PepV [Bacillota bacterium]
MDQQSFISYLDEWIPKHTDDMISSLLELISILSTDQAPAEGQPFGPEVARAFDYYIQKASEFGISSKNVDGYAIHAEIGSGDEIVMALTHADVVPIGTGWTRNPLGEVHNGKIYGRGAQDNKGPTIACLYALKAIKESGASLNRRIRHVVGGNEESGFRCVRHYFEVEEKPTYGFSPDAMFPLVYAEKGSMNVRVTAILEAGKYSLIQISGGERPNIVPEEANALLKVPEGEEQHVVNALQTFIPHVEDIVGGPGPLSFEFIIERGALTINCTGKACHASVPWEGTNAVAGLLHLIACLGDQLGSRDLIKFLAHAADIYGKGLNIECEDDISGKLSCNLGVCESSHKNGNTVVTGIYNIRYPVKASGQELKQRALTCERPETPSLTVEVISLSNSHYTDPDSFLVKTLLQIYREETGDYSPPIAIGGGTYAKVIPGGVAYGPVRPGTPETAHQADEFISIEDLLLLVKIYARAMLALAQ